MYKSLIDGSEVKIFQLGKSDKSYPDVDANLLLKDVVDKYNSGSDKIKFYLEFEVKGDKIIKKFPEYDPSSEGETINTKEEPIPKYTKTALNITELRKNWNDPSHNDYYGGCDAVKISSAIVISYLRNKNLSNDKSFVFLEGLGVPKMIEAFSYLDRIGFKFKNQEIKDFKETLDCLYKKVSTRLNSYDYSKYDVEDQLKKIHSCSTLCEKVTLKEPNFIQASIDKIRSNYFPKNSIPDISKPST